MKNDLKVPVAIFGRVSSISQDFQRQVSDLTKLADKLNFEVVDVITEKISGAKSNDERKGVQELLDGAKSGKFKKVLVSEVSRLGRSTLETLKLVEELHGLGISIYLQDLSTETLNEKGEMNMQTEMMLHMLSLFAKNERRNTIERIRSGMAQAIERGIHCGRPSGSADSDTDVLEKYKKVVSSLELGLSVRKCCKLHDVSLGTVAKVRKIWLSSTLCNAA
jgi:DNA invertase Pin-like site-specific DNA recombinase